MNLANQSCWRFCHSSQIVDRMSSCTLSVTLKVKVQVLYSDTHLYSDVLSPLPSGPQSNFPGWKTSLCPVGAEGYPVVSACFVSLWELVICLNNRICQTLIKRKKQTTVSSHCNLGHNLGLLTSVWLYGYWLTVTMIYDLCQTEKSAFSREICKEMWNLYPEASLSM